MYRFGCCRRGRGHVPDIVERKRLTQSGPTATFLWRCAKVVDGGVGRRVEPEDRSGACHAAISLQCAILIHVEWRIFPEYVGGGDQFMLRRRARWQRLAGKQPQCERQHVVAVAVHVAGDRPEHHAGAVVGSISFFSLAPPWMFGSSPWLTMTQSLCRRFISIAFLA